MSFFKPGMWVVLICMFAGLITSMAIPSPAMAATLSITQHKLGNIYQTGETVSFGITTDQSSVDYSVTDYLGKVMASGNKPVNGSTTLTLSLSAKGYFKLDLNAKSGASVVASKSTTFAILAPFDTSGISDSFFSVQTHFGNSTRQHPEIAPLLQLMGVKTVRDTQRWEYIETTKGTYAFQPFLTDYMTALSNKGIKPLMTLALDHSLYDNDGNGTGVTPYTDAGRTGFANYTKQLMQRFGSQINEVEVYNEPNISAFFTGPAAADKPEYYYQLLKSTYAAAKSVNPSVKVIGGATAGVGLPFHEAVFQKGGLAYMDAVSMHPYDHANHPELYLAQFISNLDNLVKQYNGQVSKPIYMTEDGWSSNSGGVSELTQADYLVRSYVIAMSTQKVAKYNWYNFLNKGTIPTDFERNFGLIRHPNDAMGKYVPKPGYAAYAAMTRQLTGANFVSRDKLGAGSSAVHSYVFSNSSGGTTRAMWATTDANVTLNTASAITITDMMGNSQTYAPGNHTLLLTKHPIYVSGNLTGLVYAGPGSPVSGKLYETESLTASTSTGDTRAAFTDVNLSGGAGDKLNANGVGDFVSYSVNVPEAGTFNVRVKVKKLNTRGIYQLSVDGTNQGLPMDGYDPVSNGGVYEELNLGNVNFNTAGNHMFKFTATGKHADSTGYELAVDYVLLNPVAPFVMVRELETEEATISSGDARITLTDQAMSDGGGDKLVANGIGDYISYNSIDLPFTGTYNVKVKVKKLNQRGIFQLSIDGQNQGVPQDTYDPVATGGVYTELDLGTKTFTTAGNKTFKFMITGKHSESLAYDLVLDSITLTK
ncbi:hypothetical protein SY83_20365 [Paenibacillus swuensis]|uniref:CBM6 domain-containing protein n=1 Tax=Paenibacillus swuensis TaxID=1178515 RepID=A0A172TMP2_9BACL|nr:carbohydrate-binding protein [Paenibacillus swuensis]ANE48252.1 hypothetical protein SY83_20365 [Paenibacillus swuensis]